MTGRYKTDAEIQAERDLQRVLVDLYEHQKRTLVKLQAARAAAERLAELRAVEHPQEPSDA